MIASQRRQHTHTHKFQVLLCSPSFCCSFVVVLRRSPSVLTPAVICCSGATTLALSSRSTYLSALLAAELTYLKGISCAKTWICALYLLHSSRQPHSISMCSIRIEVTHSSSFSFLHKARVLNAEKRRGQPSALPYLYYNYNVTLHKHNNIMVI